ncbi:DUF4358 domain-containing protein [Paenibacillus sp. L3-i20]|uniref:DUF4358 domain-containing protein n=1 Tax=Paenibacillus sp. L3-i20 TaxID=2905833 RepID=UPI001EDF7DD0|nr:DUF4358 domain-containing protein [Paenibacillus sp. L3-i20]GKU76298.1 hypothetical protein L3i20_v206950 [Paenibacillus sp. L3-i20]
MINNKKLFKTMAALTIALSVFAAGCSNGNTEGNANATTKPNVNEPSSTGTPEASEKPDETETPSTETTAPTATEEPTTKPSDKPTDKPTASAKPSEKPTTKPTDKPVVSQPKPTDKPSTSKPSPKPTDKPSTSKPSPKPTEKPTPTDKPKPKPTPDPESADTIKVSDIMDKILADVQLPVLMEATGEQIKDSYYFDPADLVADGVYNQAMMNTKATELVVVKLKSLKNYEDVKAGLTKRAEDIIETFSTYLQDQYEDAKNYQIIRNGNYVLLSISSDQEGIKTAFESFFKK